jgi:hypothetical protein
MYIKYIVFNPAAKEITAPSYGRAQLLLRLTNITSDDEDIMKHRRSKWLLLLSL